MFAEENRGKEIKERIQKDLKQYKKAVILKGKENCWIPLPRLFPLKGNHIPSRMCQTAASERFETV